MPIYFVFRSHKLCILSDIENQRAVELYIPIPSRTKGKYIVLLAATTADHSHLSINVTRNIHIKW